MDAENTHLNLFVGYVVITNGEPNEPEEIFLEMMCNVPSLFLELIEAHLDFHQLYFIHALKVKIKIQHHQIISTADEHLKFQWPHGVYAEHRIRVRPGYGFVIWESSSLLGLLSPYLFSRI